MNYKLLSHNFKKLSRTSSNHCLFFGSLNAGASAFNDNSNTASFPSMLLSLLSSRGSPEKGEYVIILNDYNKMAMVLKLTAILKTKKS